MSAWLGSDKIGDRNPYRPQPFSPKPGRLQAMWCMQCMTASSLLISRGLLISSMKVNVLAKSVLLLQATILGSFGWDLNCSCDGRLSCYATNLQCWVRLWLAADMEAAHVLARMTDILPISSTYCNWKQWSGVSIFTRGLIKASAFRGDESGVSFDWFETSTTCRLILPG